MYYRNEFYFHGFYRCVNSGESPTKWVKSESLYVKGKGTQKYKWILSKSAWKTACFDANCMKIGFLFFQILHFYVFKMAANEGCHFEINMKTENDITQFISQKIAYTYTNNKCDLCLLCKQSFYGVILLILYFFEAILEENQYPLWISDVTTSLIFWVPAWLF